VARSLACALVALVVAPAGASAQERCQPAKGFASPLIARGKGEVTEFFPGGAYRVTRCDSGGKLAFSATLAPVGPPLGVCVI
jgi:hypothetical protein